MYSRIFSITDTGTAHFKHYNYSISSCHLGHILNVLIPEGLEKGVHMQNSPYKNVCVLLYTEVPSFH